MDQLPKYKLMQRWSFMSNIMKIADDGAPIVEPLNTCFTCLGESFPFISLFLIPKKIFFCSLRKINLVDFSSLYLNRYSSTVRVLPNRSCGVGNQISSSQEVEGKPLQFLLQVSGRRQHEYPKQKLAFYKPVTFLQFLIPPAPIMT